MSFSTPPSQRQKDSAAKFENLQLNPKQLLATKKLWREASTGDCYFKAGTDEIMGINNAVREGGSLDWKSPDCAGFSLFMRACHNNEFDLVKYMWQFQPDVTVVDYTGTRREVWSMWQLSEPDHVSVTVVD